MSEIAALFGTIQQMVADLDDAARDLSEEEAAARLTSVEAVAANMMSLEPRTEADLAMQIAWYLGEGSDPEDELGGEHFDSEPIVRERVRRLAGLPLARERVA